MNIKRSIPEKKHRKDLLRDYKSCLVHGRGDDNEETDDLTDLLAALLELSVSPEVSNSLEVVEKLLAVAEDVTSLTDEDLEDLTSTDVSDDVTDGALKARKTAGVHGLADGLDGISELLKSTLDGLDAELLETGLKIGPGSIHLSNDDVEIAGAARGITHAGAHALSNTTDKLVHVLSRRSNGDLVVLLVDEDAEDLSHILTGAVEVLGLPFGGDVLEEVDELTTVTEDVHDLVLDESHDLAVLDLLDDLDDILGGLLDTASLESVGKLLNTVGKGEEALHDSLHVKSLDTVSNKLNTIIEIASHVSNISHASGGVAHHNVETISDTLEEGNNVLLALKLAITSKLSIRGNNEARLIECSGRNDQSKKNKSYRTHG